MRKTMFLKSVKNIAVALTMVLFAAALVALRFAIWM